MIPEMRELARTLLNCTKVEGGCWIYTKSVSTQGYPQTKLGQTNAHRFVYEMLMGVKLDKVMEVHHLCGEKRCVNPRHMEVLHHDEHARLHNPTGRGTKTHCGRCGAEKTVSVVERGKTIMRCDPCRKAAQKRSDAKRRVR